MSSSPLSVLVRAAASRLAQAGVPDPHVDAELLAAFVLEASRGEVQAAIVRGDTMDVRQSARFEQLLVRRSRREPLQHLTGRAPFRHLELAVGPGVFVPRPETEIVAQYAIDALLAAADPAPIGVDLGTGSGAIALAMATEVPHAQVYAAEVSAEAHAWAEKNTKGVDNLVLRHADLATAFAELSGTVAVLVSNPPYIPDEAIPRDPEVRLFDPPLALYGGADGLDIVRILSGRGRELLRPGGSLILEHGELQGEAIRGILLADGWHAVSTHPDLTGRDRATTALRA